MRKKKVSTKDLLRHIIIKNALAVVKTTLLSITILLSGTFLVVFLITGCSDAPYTGSMLKPENIDKYFFQPDTTTLCLTNSLDEICVTFIPKGRDPTLPVIHIYPKKVTYVFYHQGLPVVRAERPRDDVDTEQGGGGKQTGTGGNNVGIRDGDTSGGNNVGMGGGNNDGNTGKNTGGRDDGTNGGNTGGNNDGTTGGRDDGSSAGTPGGKDDGNNGVNNGGIGGGNNDGTNGGNTGGNNDGTTGGRDDGSSAGTPGGKDSGNNGGNTGGNNEEKNDDNTDVNNGGNTDGNNDGNTDGNNDGNNDATDGDKNNGNNRRPTLLRNNPNPSRHNPPDNVLSHYVYNTNDDRGDGWVVWVYYPHNYVKDDNSDGVEDNPREDINHPTGCGFTLSISGGTRTNFVQTSGPCTDNDNNNRDDYSNVPCSDTGSDYSAQFYVASTAIKITLTIKWTAGMYSGQTQVFNIMKEINMKNWDEAGYDINHTNQDGW